MKISLSQILKNPIIYHNQKASDSLLQKIITYYSTQSQKNSLRYAAIVNFFIPLAILFALWLFFFGGLDFLFSQSSTPIVTVEETNIPKQPVPSSLEKDIFQSLTTIFSEANKYGSSSGNYR